MKMMVMVIIEEEDCGGVSVKMMVMVINDEEDCGGVSVKMMVMMRRRIVVVSV